MSEETQRVLNEKIKVPAQLMSSLVAGNTAPFGESWNAIRPPEADDSAWLQNTSTRIYDPEAVGKSEHQTLLARIRKLVTKEPGWLAGSDLRTLAEAERRKAKIMAARKSMS